MKIRINLKDREVPPGALLADVVKMIRDADKEDPVSKSLVEKTGSDYLTFVHNGRIVKPGEYDSIVLKDGDEIRWMHPYAGG